MANIVLYGCRCLLGHVNMSAAALEQCVSDIFVNQSLENIQRIRRLIAYHKPHTQPRLIALSAKNFNPGVVLALDQIIAKNHIGKKFN